MSVYRVVDSVGISATPIGVRSVLRLGIPAMIEDRSAVWAGKRRAMVKK